MAALWWTVWTELSWTPSMNFSFHFRLKFLPVLHTFSFLRFSQISLSLSLPSVWKHAAVTPWPCSSPVEPQVCQKWPSTPMLVLDWGISSLESEYQCRNAAHLKLECFTWHCNLLAFKWKNVFVLFWGWNKCSLSLLYIIFLFYILFSLLCLISILF